MANLFSSDGNFFSSFEKFFVDLEFFMTQKFIDRSRMHFFIGVITSQQPFSIVRVFVKAKSEDL